jgi:predicted lipopolysaccharide heptosyltransferase III
VKILLIRLRLIGDVVFTTPVAAALDRQFPDATMTYLVESTAEPVVRHNPHIDEILVVERPRGLARLAYDLRLALRLRRRRFDLVIDLHGGPRSGWLTWATGAPARIGYARPGRRWCYTTRVPWSPALVPPRHSVRNQWDLLVPLGMSQPAFGSPATEMPGDPAATAAIAQRLAAAGVDAGDQLIVLHVSAGNPFRRWPADRFADLAATLACGSAGRRIIITSGPSEAEAADAIAHDAQARAGDHAGRILRCGEFDLSELRALLARAALYVGGDSGPLHIASTTAVPIVALFGPTVPERSMPWRTRSRAMAVDAGPLPCRPCHQRRCVPGDFRCLTGIPAAAVVAAAESLLQESGAS